MGVFPPTGLVAGAADVAGTNVGEPSGAFGVTVASGLQPTVVKPSTATQNTLLINVNNLAIACSI